MTTEEIAQEINERKRRQPDTTHRRTPSIEAGNLSAADCPIESSLLPFFSCMFFDQSGAGRQNSRKRKKETTDAGTESPLQ